MDTCLPYVISLSISNVISLAIYANYSIRLKEKQLILEKKIKEQKEEIEKIKQKNGNCFQCSKNLNK